jgi:hypothetical protein
MDFLNREPREGFESNWITEAENGTVRHGDDLPKVIHKQNAAVGQCNNAATTASVASCHNSASRDSSDHAERNFCANVTRSLHATAVFSQTASAIAPVLNMSLAREGAAIAAAIARREQLQLWEDLIADALYDHETGVVSHRRQAEAVLASLLNAGVVR